MMGDASSIRTYRDALRAIWLRSAYDRGFISNPFWGDDAADLGLRRTEGLLEILGRPHDRYKIAHVAGSKGKGSTCAFISSIATASGHTTGLYTSPHLHSFRERIATGGVPISEAMFTQLTRDVLISTVQLERERPELGELTAFELVTVMAFVHFAAEACDVAVIEVGMGGTLDATNVVDPAVSVITALDYEHTKVLGSTLAEIAANKAGIIKQGQPVVALSQEREPLELIEETARARNSRLLLEDRDWTTSGNWLDFTASGPWGRLDQLRISLPGAHQVQNAGAAIAAAWLLSESVDQSSVGAGLANATWPGRYEIVNQPGQAKVILDGAHTPASARALADAVLAEDQNEQRIVVLGMMSDKDPRLFARELAILNAPIVVTESRSPRAASTSTVLFGVEAAGLQGSAVQNVHSALSAASQVVGVQGTVIVTGSLGTVAEAREALGLAVPDPPVDDLALAQDESITDSSRA